MNVIRSFRNLDRHGQQRAPEVIEEEVRQLEPHLARFREDLVRLEVVASQTRGKTRIKVSLRLQLPSGVIAAPTATPRIVRAATETCPSPRRRTPASAASRQASIGPNRNGSGRSPSRKIAVPAKAMATVRTAREKWLCTETRAP